MSRSRNREETEWLGGETLVRPHSHEPRVSLLNGVIASGIVLLAAVGFRRLMRGGVGKQARESPRRLDRTNHAKTRSSQECVNAMSAMAIGAAWGAGMVIGAMTMLLGVTKSGGRNDSLPVQESKRDRRERCGPSVVGEEIERASDDIKVRWSP